TSSATRQLTLLAYHVHCRLPSCIFFFFFTAASPTEIYTLSLHDALPIFLPREPGDRRARRRIESETAVVLKPDTADRRDGSIRQDRKSTRLNSSHSQISYAVFCLKKKKKKHKVI